MVCFELFLIFIRNKVVNEDLCLFHLERDILYSQWKMAINRSLGWEPITDTNGTFSL